MKHVLPMIAALPLSTPALLHAADTPKPNDASAAESASR